MKRLGALNLSLYLLFAIAGIANATPVALTPSTTIDVSTGLGTVSGAVSTGHNVFDFYAFAGDSVTLDIDVTEILQGTLWKDDDTKLFLFDSEGYLVAANDDENFDTLESLIKDYFIATTGTYYVVVTTYGNYPVFTDEIVTGWEDDGESSVKYNLTVTGVSPVPLPSTLFLLAPGFVSLLFLRRFRHY